CYALYWFSYAKAVFNPKPDDLDRRFRVSRETLSRFSCAASLGEQIVLPLKYIMISILLQ
ncbi:hypothetical protein ACTMNS_03705, partial [Staphylococcus haemolyticus]